MVRQAFGAETAWKGEGGGQSPWILVLPPHPHAPQDRHCVDAHSTENSLSPDVCLSPSAGEAASRSAFRTTFYLSG